MHRSGVGLWRCTVYNIRFLLTEREVCTEEYFAQGLCTGRGASPRSVPSEGKISSVQTDQAWLISISIFETLTLMLWKHFQTQ